MTTPSTSSPLPQLPEASFVRLALFPAKVTLSSPSQAPEFTPSNNTKIFVTDSYLIAVQDSPTGPTPTLIQELIDFQGNNKIGYTAQTPAGDIHIIRARGCGCGSRLRGFHPFRSVPYRGAEYV